MSEIITGSDGSAEKVQKSLARENRAPYTIVKHRIPEGTIRHSERIPRYWKSKASGEVVEVRRFLHVVPEYRKKVVFFDQTLKQEFSAFLEDFKRDFEPYGNMSDQF